MKYILILFLALSATLVHGQIATTMGQGQDLFQKNLYSADRVMEMRTELGLTDAQANKIKKIHSENAGKFSTMKWDLDDETKKLKALLDESKIDQDAVQKQMDKVLALENSLKKQQLGTMVSIKNELSPEQQEILQKNTVYVIRGASSVNGVQGFSSKSGTATSIQGSNIRVGQPNYVMTWDRDKAEAYGNGSYSPNVSVMVAGTDKNDAPLYYIETKDGMKEVKNFDNIDPKNIQSMEVFKGEKAIEKFGEKAENGAIVIKLKNDPK
jgi:Spy/CpxP family protein refolding chaperone